MEFIKKVLWIIKITLFSIIECFTNMLPEGSYGDIVRGQVLKIQMKKCGKKFRVSRNVKVLNAKKLIVGDNVYLGYGDWIDAKYGVEIGDNTMIGPYVIIASGNHSFEKETMSFFNNSYGKKIKVGLGCWIAGNSVITSGVQIEDYCLIGGGTVISKDIPKNKKVVEINKIIGTIYEE